MGEKFYYQEHPIRNSNAPWPESQRSFTVSLDAYHKAAFYQYTIQTGFRADYGVALTMNVEEDLTISQHKKLWAKVVRAITKNKLECFWVREIARNNRIHYHFCFWWGHEASQYTVYIKDATQNNLINLLKDTTKGIRTNIRVRKIYAGAKWLEYILKTRDINRVLFVRNLGLSKCGTIGYRITSREKQRIWGGAVARFASKNKQWEEYKAEHPELQKEFRDKADGIDRILQPEMIVEWVDDRYLDAHNTENYLWRRHKKAFMKRLGGKANEKVRFREQEEHEFY